MSKKIVADFDKVVIKPTEKSNEMYGNIVIADAGKEKPEVGIIVSIGPGASSITGVWIPTTKKVGDEVVLPKFGATVYTLDGEDYYITKESEILAHLEEEN
jgi:chaperonin GroES